MSPRTRLTVTLVLGLSACTARPLDNTTDSTTDASSSSSSPSSSATSDAATTTATATTSASTSTSDASTATATSTSGTTNASTSTTSGGPPSECGPPCAETWEIVGDLDISSWGDPPIVFDCLTSVQGTLTIEEDVSPNILASLANLRKVANGLLIYPQAELTDLDFLSCLEETAGLEISGTPKLADLGGLSHLRISPWIHLRGLPITGLPSFAPDFAGISDLTLADNPALTDLGVASTWGLGGDYLRVNLDNNAGLTSIAGLKDLVAALGPVPFHLQITDHPALTSLTGLEPLTTMGELWLSGLPKVEDLAPLKNLTSADAITLDEIPKLTSLADLAALTSTFQLTLGDCVNQGQGGLDGLTSLAGLEGLTTAQLLGIANNDGLTSLDGAPKLTSVNFLAVTGNAALTQKAHDAFLAQLAFTPNDECFGPWDQCQCFQLMPW